MATRKKNIVVVEDEVIVAQDVTSSLQALGYEVPAMFMSAEEVIESFTDLKPDLVLMDIKLKGNIDGIDAGEIIRFKHSIPVVYMTAYSGDNIIPRAKKSMPYGYIIKPFDSVSLYTTIEMALYKHEFERILVNETENALASIIGCVEVLVDENIGNASLREKLDKIKKSALIIRETIEKF